MKSATIRIIVVLTLLACAGIILTQMYWVRSALELQEKTFDLKVNTALRAVASDVMHAKQTQIPNYSPVDQVSPDYFVVQTNVFVEQDLLEHFLITAFTKQNILTDFEYGLYDCMSDTVQYRGYHLMPGASESRPDKPAVFPQLKHENYYFGVYFPHRQKFLSAQLSVWTVSSLLLLCILGFLGYLLFVIFKQKRLSEIQKDFVNNMTHEFKTPLSTIQVSADVLRNPNITQQPERLLNYANIISDESTRLATHVERVLHMAQAQKGRILLKYEPFVWQQLLTEVSTTFSNLAKSSGTIIRLHMPDEPVHYNGDLLHLKNAVTNLLDNAVKYCEHCPEIDISLNLTRGSVEIAVKDNGIGIAKVHQKLLFQKFYRVPTGNIHNVKGFGLGLNYVRLIVRAHGGTIMCESGLGKGSIFTLTFPRNKKLG